MSYKRQVPIIIMSYKYPVVYSKNKKGYSLLWFDI